MNLRSVAALLVVVVLGLAGWFFARDTDVWAELTGESVANEQTDPLASLRTATVSRTSVADTATLVGELRYQDAAIAVHRVDPIVTTVTQQIGIGRQAQTVTTTVEDPGQRSVTALPREGSVVSPGDVLYETDSTPVYAVAGSTPAFRTMDSETSGDDVAQLQDYLSDGGWAADELVADGQWSSTTTTAVEQWQSETGQTITGIVELGDLWFIASPIRITDVTATVGVVVNDGTELFHYTSGFRAIEARVQELPEGLLNATDLTARLPDGSVVPASVRSITGSEAGFDVLVDVELPESGVPQVNGLEITTTWTTTELVDALAVPPEAIRRLESGTYVVDVVNGDEIQVVEVDVVGQAGRVVAIEGVVERAEVVVP